MAGSTVDMNVQDKLRGIASRNYEEEEKGKKGGSKHSHGAVHHKTRKNKMDADRRAAEERARKDKEKESKKGTTEDVKSFSKPQLEGFVAAVRSAGKGNPIEYDGKVYEMSPSLARAIDQRGEELEHGGGKGGVKYTVAYDKWVRDNFALDIKKGADVNEILADQGIQQKFQKTSGQSPIAK